MNAISGPSTGIKSVCPAVFTGVGVARAKSALRPLELPSVKF